ncbi:MAG: YicC family protein [Flavobacteriales bacterium]|nr:YicC family protein [Flavobacteriales bacterium]MCW8912428.1 YicC family protein [Flavobacteriales bacterium]MCW8936512.1 YicC family protein [Flavobacteriales bacterium]MCW8941251.1 YicC family protein [Flavobacteriales bacterium]MCW8969581.1 YicC family protein [Flavobacteriales bacterium]
MIKSMTGFGKSATSINQKKISIEIRSLNSKQADISIRIPAVYKEKELELRAKINQHLERGKIEFNLYVEQTTATPNYQINESLFKNYYNELKRLSDELGEQSDLIKIVTGMPDVFQKEEKQAMDESEWQTIVELTTKALQDIDAYRTDEGNTLQKEMELRINNIQQLLNKVELYEKERIITVRERITAHLEEIVNGNQIDKDRLEQELVFYIEKFDVSEEKQRLQSHLDYFMDTMNDKDSQGKKLGFISQEMGREINTLGSKANHSELQKIVVEMKDELEKIKEQILNIL